MPAPASDQLPVLGFDTKEAWTAWLAKNHSTSTGLWVKIAKKASGHQSVTYDEALDSALCYGWIDGQRKSLDATHFLQKFTPRRKGSLWSKRNVGKVAVLIEAGSMQSAGLAEIEKARANGQWDRAYDGTKLMAVPEDFQAALDAEPKANEFFATLNRTQRYSYSWRVQTAKTPATRARLITKFIADLAAGLPFHRPS